MAGAIDQAEPEDGVVFAEETIRQPAAEQREKVNADDEGMEHILRRARAIRLRQILQQRRYEKHRQDVAHAIEAETLASFVANDVTNLAGDGRRGWSCVGDGVAHVCWPPRLP